jgi:DHA1 family tetracycline resistance protein-like MFS transporter
MTQLFSRFSGPDAPVYLPGAPYLVSAVLVFLCVLICARSVRPARP